VASGNNQSGTVGAALAQPFVVRVEDASGSPMAGVTVVWTVVSGGGAVESATTTTANNGQAQTLYTLGPVPGTNQVRAAVQGSTLETTFTATGEAPPATNTPADIQLISGNNQSASAGGDLPDSLVVEVRNGEGTPLANVVIAWAVTAGGGTLGSATSTTNAQGQASNTYTVGGSAGVNTIEAAVQSNTSLNVEFTATATAAGAAAAVNVQDNVFNPANVRGTVTVQ
jgi:hypothetical protein